MSDEETRDEAQSLYVRISDKCEIKMESDDIGADWERVKATVDSYLESRVTER